MSAMRTVRAHSPGAELRSWSEARAAREASASLREIHHGLCLDSRRKNVASNVAP